MSSLGFYPKDFFIFKEENMKLKDLSTKYDFTSVEQGKYDTWIQKGYFTAGDVSKTPYCVVIPPPNITGKLHLGHVLNNTLQDIIVRRKRMQGFDVLWLPGMDHASIATQAKVEEKLRQQGISRYDLGREKFMDVSWQWKDEYAKAIKEQWAILGISVDYTKERFTLDEGLNNAVNEVFIRMYEDKLIYRGERIINWDVQSKTALSNIEVEYKDIEGAFYHYVYPFVGEEGGLEIATTRPETMFGDVALMVHPEDERYKQFIGKEVYIPTTKRKIPVIGDAYVEMDFGTGVVKVTPAHDPNDFEVGERHNLTRPLCMDEGGFMNELAGEYAGMERFSCRRKVVEDLKQIGLLKKVEKMIHSVGHSERTGVVVEPRLSKQWFVDMKPLAQITLDAQQNPDDKIHFVPARFEKTFQSWLENIQDWCISRQLWWGHRIPAWYRGEETYVGNTPPVGEGWVQDEDALDTWFSSALWPFSTLGWPEDTNDLKRYFPTDVLVTGYDIIFFWVARMALQSKYFLNKRPFKDVLIHGIIRDELGRKVSKSLGNGKDMQEAAKEYGVDAMRYFITTSSSPGQDIRYSDEKAAAAWNYINKIWNISRYIGITLDQNNYTRTKIDVTLCNDVDKWLLGNLNVVISSVDQYYEKYEFGEAAKVLYKFVWDDFASWYLEMSKVVFQEAPQTQKDNTCAILDYTLGAILKLLHPFMPFVTEEIYQRFHMTSITVAPWPKVKNEFSFDTYMQMDAVFEMIVAVRAIRHEKAVPNSKKIDLEIFADRNTQSILEKNTIYLQRFINYNTLEFVDEIVSSQKVVQVLSKSTIAIPLATLVNLDEEKMKLQTKEKELVSEITRCEKMLSNANFIQKAPPKKIEEEKEKLASYQKQLEEVHTLLKDFT